MTNLDDLWHLPPTELILTSSDVHVWRANLDQSAVRVHQLAETLSADELVRAERFYFEQDRKHFIVGRGLLREILSCYLGINAKELQFCYGSRGKPALLETFGDSKLCFNLSHSQGLALYAVTCDRFIGIDVEYLRPIAEVEQIAASFFSGSENAVLRNLPLSQKQLAFFRCWTRKEAYIKAVGDGLAIPLNQFDVSLAPGEPAKLLSITGDRAAAHEWSLQELFPAPDYIAAIAVKGHNWNLTCWESPITEL